MLGVVEWWLGKARQRRVGSQGLGRGDLRRLGDWLWLRRRYQSPRARCTGPAGSAQGSTNAAERAALGEASGLGCCHARL
jgi:hypothetical protein